MPSIDAECPSCGGTGLYVGFAEPKGYAVICVTCDGTGCQKIVYKPFVKRKPRSGITKVMSGAGWASAASRPSISYEDFLAGRKPE